MLTNIEQCSQDDTSLIMEMTNRLLSSEKLRNPETLAGYFSDLDCSEEVTYREYHKAMIEDEPVGFIRIDIDIKDYFKPRGNISSLFVQFYRV